MKTPTVQVTRAVQQIAEGLSFEAVARIEGVAPATVSNWMKRAVWQAERIDQDLVQNIETETVEVDEVYSFAGTKAKLETPLSEIGKHWTHCSFARRTRLILAVQVGIRDEVLAHESVAETASR